MEVIEVDFIKKEKVKNYTVHKLKCTLCNSIITYDSRKTSGNKPYIHMDKSNKSVCQDCALAIKEVAINEKW